MKKKVPVATPVKSKPITLIEKPKVVIKTSDSTSSNQELPKPSVKPSKK